MTYVHVPATVAGTPIAVAAGSAVDPAWMEGAEELLKGALSAYNDALRALQANRIPEAIQKVDAAIELFPYAPIILELGVALHLQHGLIERAHQLVGHLARIGAEETAPGFEPEVSRRAQEWNAFLQDRSLLVQKYASGTLNASYREMLLLADRPLPGLSDDTYRLAETYGIVLHSAAPATTSVTLKKPIGWKQATIGLAAILVTVTLAVVVGLRTSSVHTAVEHSQLTLGAVDESAARTEQPGSPDAQRFIQAGQLFLSPEAAAVEALVVLDSIEAGTVTPAEVERLRGLILSDLGQRIDLSWKKQDYHQLARELQPLLHSKYSENPEWYYRLGFSASEVGDTSTAVSAFKRSLPSEAGSVPYYQAEALYRLAILSEPGQAQAYAKELSDKHPTSIYINSRIRALLVP